MTPELCISGALPGGSLLQHSPIRRYHFPPEPRDSSSCLFDSMAAKMIHLGACLLGTQLPNTVPSHREPECHRSSSLSKHGSLPLLLAATSKGLGQVVYRWKMSTLSVEMRMGGRTFDRCERWSPRSHTVYQQKVGKAELAKRKDQKSEHHDGRGRGRAEIRAPWPHLPWLMWAAPSFRAKPPVTVTRTTHTNGTG